MAAACLWHLLAQVWTLSCGRLSLVSELHAFARLRPYTAPRRALGVTNWEKQAVGTAFVSDVHVVSDLDGRGVTEAPCRSDRSARGKARSTRTSFEYLHFHNVHFRDDAWTCALQAQALHWQSWGLPLSLILRLATPSAQILHHVCSRFMSPRPSWRRLRHEVSVAVAFSNKSVLRRLASARAAADLPLLAGDAAPRNHRLVCGVACRSRSLFSLLASRKSPIMPTRLGATCPVRVDAQCGRKSGKVDMGLTMVLGQDAAEWFLDSRSWEKRLQATAAAVFLFCKASRAWAVFIACG
eukprot:s1317_g3.t1